jgi:hypothetical protein
MVVLELDVTQATYLKDIVEWWLSDYDEATEEIVTSPAECFEDIGEWSEAVGRAKWNKEDAEVIKARLEMLLAS